MVKPNTNNPVELPFHSSLPANNPKEHFRNHTDDGTLQMSGGDSGWRDDERKILNLALDMRAKYGVEAAEIPPEKNDLDKIRNEMLLPEFKSIRCKPSQTQQQHIQVLGTMHGVSIRDGSFKQKLEGLEKIPRIIRDPPKLVNVKSFEEVGSLGKGADAECFLYKEKNTEKRIVHKKYYEKPRERERAALAALRHKNIPAVYGMIEEDGRHVLQMEFCGYSIRHWKRNIMVNEPGILEICEQLTDVLCHLDNHNVIHRDIKPDNVCIQTASTGLMVKLIDFGSVQTAQDEVTQGGRFTAAYMAPEMCLFCIISATQVTSKADVFACALTICYLVYNADLVPQVLGTNDQKQIIREMIRNPSCVSEYVRQTFPLDKYSEALKSLLLRMLEGHPGNRISAADAHKVIVELRRRPVYEALDAEEIKEKLGINIVNHTAPLNISTQWDTPFYPETLLITEKVDYVSNCGTSQGETDSLSPREAVDNNYQTFSDILLGQMSSEQGTTAPMHTAGMRLPDQTAQQINHAILYGIESAKTTMLDRGFWQSSINGAIKKSVFVPIQQSTSILANDTLYGYMLEDVLELVPVNQVAGTIAVPEMCPQTAVPEGRPLIAVSEGRPLTAVPGGRPETAVPEMCPQTAVTEGRPLTVVSEGRRLIVVPEALPQTAVPEMCPQTAVTEGRPLTVVSEGRRLIVVPEALPQTAVPEMCPQTAVTEGRPLTVVSEGRPQTVVPEALPQTAVTEGCPLILNQEQLPLIQHSRANSTQSTSVSNGDVANFKLGGSQLQEDCPDVTNLACVDKAPEPPAKQETMNRLKDRLQTGPRKRSYYVPPNEYSNMPNLDLIQCKKKRKEKD